MTRAPSRWVDVHRATRLIEAANLAGRDKNGKAAKLPRPPSSYVRSMYTDTVSPHSMGIKFAIDYYGIDHVMYGTDYPCWDPATALALIGEIGLSDADTYKLFYGNARRIVKLRDPVTPELRNAIQSRTEQVSQ